MLHAGNNIDAQPRYDVFDIAKWFIWRSKCDEDENDAEPLTLLKLMKLLYYAEGCSLASGNGSLFPDKFEGWEHGPAIRAVWEAYHSDSRHLPYDERHDMPKIQRISEDDQNLLESVYETFGVYTAWGLRQKTHRETPWLLATQNGEVLNREITRDSIEDYFQKHYVRDSYL